MQGCLVTGTSKGTAGGGGAVVEPSWRQCLGYDAEQEIGPGAPVRFAECFVVEEAQIAGDDPLVNWRTSTNWLTAESDYWMTFPITGSLTLDDQGEVVVTEAESGLEQQRDTPAPASDFKNQVLCEAAGLVWSDGECTEGI